MIKKFLLLIHLILTFIIINPTDSHADNLWYISPGICFGRNSAGNFVVDGKISVGVNVDNRWNRLIFYNMTIGFNALPFAKKANVPFKEFNYVQFQLGGNLIEENLLITGMGAGFIFNTNSENDLSPMVRLFTGFIAFPEMNIMLLNASKTYIDFGVRGVVPIPLGPLELGLD